MDFYILTEKYIEGNLSKEEKRHFEEEITKNTSLKEFLDTRMNLEHDLKSYFQNKHAEGFDREILDMIREYYSMERFKDSEEIRKFRTDLEKASRGKEGKNSLFMILSIAASIASLLILGTAILKIFQHREKESFYTSIYNSVFHPIDDPVLNNYIDIESYMLLHSSTDSLYQSKVWTMRPELLRNSGKSDAEILSLSIFYMDNKEFEFALMLLKQLIDKHENQYREICSWYYSLALVATHQDKSAIDYLDKIASGKGQYSKQAKELWKILTKK